MIPSEASSVSDAYHHKYAGKTLLLKVSGRTLLSEAMPDLIQDIQALAREHIRFIVVCGAGEQNTRYFKEYIAQTGQAWTEPQRVGGRRVTDEQQMVHGVLPAHQSIQAQLQQWLPEASILTPEQLHCRHLTELGFVGEPESVEGLQASPVIVIPSVGSDGQTLLNVNADDTARVIVKQEHPAIDEAIFVTETGGVLHKESVATLLWKEDIADDGTHAFIDVTGGGGGMQKKLREARQMLDYLAKVVITGVSGVRREIEQILGSGTLVVARSNVRCMPPPHCADDEAIFDALYAKNVAMGIFRNRSQIELKELKKYVYLLKVSNSVLGAFSLIPREGGWMECAAMCSDYEKSGVGDVILKEAQAMADHIYGFASTLGSLAVFLRNGFENHGDVSTLQHMQDSPYSHFPCVAQYHAPKRNPYFCTWHKG